MFYAYVLALMTTHLLEVMQNMLDKLQVYADQKGLIVNKAEI